MNWTQFILSLAGIYLIYYLLNLLFDLLRPRPNAGKNSGQQELTFFEDHQPEIVMDEVDEGEVVKYEAELPESRQAMPSGILQSTGGVSLKQLFSLAQSDLIEFTRTIPY